MCGVSYVLGAHYSKGYITRLPEAMFVNRITYCAFLRILVYIEKVDIRYKRPSLVLKAPHGLTRELDYASTIQIQCPGTTSHVC